MIPRVAAVIGAFALRRLRRRLAAAAGVMFVVWTGVWAAGGCGIVVPPVSTKDPAIAQGDRLNAVSNVCRHQFGKLGRGQVRDGCLECPWHRAR